MNILKDSGAIFSEDRRYRYVLYRGWSDKPKLMYIGLNPSRANETKPDNTITKLIKVTANNGYGGFYMLNLFGLVSPKPEVLLRHDDPVGDNDLYIDAYSKASAAVVFCWGNFRIAEKRSWMMEEKFPSALCFVRNRNGSPKHPLYCPDKSILIPYKHHG